MTFGHGKNATLHVNGVDWGEFATSVAMAASTPPAETTTIGLGTDAKTYIPGVSDATLSIEGFFDPVHDSTVNALLAVKGAVVTQFPTLAVVGGRGMGLSGIVVAKPITSPIEGVTALNAEIQSTIGWEDIVNLNVTVPAVTGAGNGVTVDNGAATAFGGSIYISNQGFTGTSVDVTIRHSTDDFAGDDTLLGTFTQITGAPNGERVSIAPGTTIKQYVRAVYTGTFSSLIAMIGVHRAQS